MQYESSLDKDELVDLALTRYFAQVDAKNLDAVLDCFHDNAMITVQTAFTTHVGKEGIKRMFVDFMDSYKTIIHRDFTCTAELEDHDGGKVLLENTNFWRVRGDKFQEVYIYMSGANPLV